MEYKTRKYPLFSNCGLLCGLCPRYYTDGPSKCTGCAGEGFLKVHPTCGILSCAQRNGFEFCYECDDFPCKRHNRWGDSDSFITHRNYLLNLEKAKQIGIEAYMAELNEKVRILEELLNNYNDGRRKSFYCTAVNLMDLDDVKIVMDQIGNEVDPEMDAKTKALTAARLFSEMAEKRSVPIKLRK